MLLTADKHWAFKVMGPAGMVEHVKSYDTETREAEVFMVDSDGNLLREGDQLKTMKKVLPDTYVVDPRGNALLV